MFAFPPKKYLIGLVGAFSGMLAIPTTGTNSDLVRGTLNTRILPPMDHTTHMTIRFREESEISDRLSVVARRALVEQRFSDLIERLVQTIGNSSDNDRLLAD